MESTSSDSEWEYIPAETNGGVMEYPPSVNDPAFVMEKWDNAIRDCKILAKALKKASAEKQDMAREMNLLKVRREPPIHPLLSLTL